MDLSRKSSGGVSTAALNRRDRFEEGATPPLLALQLLNGRLVVGRSPTGGDIRGYLRQPCPRSDASAPQTAPTVGPVC